MATKVYFNNSCSICRFEINHYKKLENNLEWIDISTEKKSKKDTAKNAKELLRRLHTVKNNKVYSGVDAFIEMWSEIPRYSFLAKIIRKPLIYQVSWFLYEVFALILFYKNKNQQNKIERILVPDETMYNYMQNKKTKPFEHEVIFNIDKKIVKSN